MVKPKISIIIPVYNSGAYLKKTLASIKEEIPTEVILVNDGSTDKATKSVLKELASSYNVIDKVNGGSSSARNAGAASATASYVLFLDSDDLIEENFCTKAVAALEGHPEVSYVYPGAVLFGDRVGYWPNRPFDARLLRYYTYFLVTSPMRKDFFEKMGGFDESYPKLEDREFWVRSVAKGFVGMPVDSIFFYRHHGQSKTAGVNRKKEMFAYETRIRRGNAKIYSWKDRLVPSIVFYSTYLRLYYFVPKALKDYLLMRNLKAFLSRPGIARRFPEEVKANFCESDLSEFFKN